MQHTWKCFLLSVVAFLCNTYTIQVDVWLGKQVVKVTFNCLTPVQKFVGKKNVLLTRVFTHSEAIAAMRQQEAKVPKLPAQARLLQEALKKRGLVQDSVQDAQQAPKRANHDTKHNPV